VKIINLEKKENNQILDRTIGGSDLENQQATKKNGAMTGCWI